MQELTLKRRLLFASLMLLGFGLTYVGSYGLLLNHAWNYPDASDRILMFYRPLCRAVPKPWMESYTQVCGYTDVEAFFLVQVMEGDFKLAPRPMRVSFQLDY